MLHEFFSNQNHLKYGIVFGGGQFFHHIDLNRNYKFCTLRRKAHQLCRNQIGRDSDFAAEAVVLLALDQASGFDMPGVQGITLETKLDIHSFESLPEDLPGGGHMQDLHRGNLLEEDTLSFYQVLNIDTRVMQLDLSQREGSMGF